MEIQVEGIPVTVEKKKIKNMYLRVLPPDGRVSVSAPRTMKNEFIQAFVLTKISWIKKQQMKLHNQLEQPQTVQRQYASGETVCLWGRNYKLEVVPSDTRRRITIVGERLIFEEPDDSTVTQSAAYFNEWYRSQLKQAIPGLISKWQTVIPVEVREWGVKNMKTRWGTCNVGAGRIWLNLQLAKKKPECLEYVVVHEMTHLLEASHNARFWGLMDRFLPDWKVRKDELNE